jgi:hypothetical protein
MAAEILELIEKLAELQNFPIQTLSRLSLKLNNEISAWGNTEPNVYFDLTTSNVKNIVQESVSAKKVIDDLSNWGQQKQLENSEVYNGFCFRVLSQ